MRDYGTVHYCEGEFWRFTGKQWEVVPEGSLRRTVMTTLPEPIGSEGPGVITC